jgi:uncharacterized protein (TIGR03000 family)
MCGLLWPDSSASAAEKQANSPSATVRVLLPKHAKLTIDGKAAGPRSGSRRSITLPLEKGNKSRFTIQAEFRRGKKTITVRRQVTLRAGQKRVVSLRLRGTYGRSALSGANRRGRVYSYRFTVEHPYDPAYGNYSYRDMGPTHPESAVLPD